MAVLERCEMHCLLLQVNVSSGHPNPPIIAFKHSISIKQEKPNMPQIFFKDPKISTIQLFKKNLKIPTMPQMFMENLKILSIPKMLMPKMLKKNPKTCHLSS